VKREQQRLAAGCRFLHRRAKIIGELFQVSTSQVRVLVERWRGVLDHLALEPFLADRREDLLTSDLLRVERDAEQVPLPLAPQPAVLDTRKP